MAVVALALLVIVVATIHLYRSLNNRIVQNTHSIVLPKTGLLAQLQLLDDEVGELKKAVQRLNEEVEIDE